MNNEQNNAVFITIDDVQKEHEIIDFIFDDNIIIDNQTNNDIVNDMITVFLNCDDCANQNENDNLDNLTLSINVDNMFDELTIFDAIPTDEDGIYFCPVCNNRYSTEYLLGSHYDLYHNNYTNLLELSEQKQKIGFPGINILIYIGMLSKIYNYKELMMDNKICPICAEYYIFPDEKPNFYKLNKKITRSLSSDDINIIKENKYKNKKMYYPQLLTCCEQYLCTKCLKEFLLNSVLLLCPYCGKDHTINDKDYITIYEIGELNKYVWKKWWSKIVKSE